MKLLAKIIIVLAIFFGGFYVGQKQALSPSNGLPVVENKNVGQEVQEGISVNLMIDFGNGEVKSYGQVSLNNGKTVLELLKKATSDNNLELKYKDYGDELGVFIESVSGVGNDSGSDKFWQYWVNGDYSKVGASSYQLKDGDVVEWKYIKGQIN